MKRSTINIFKILVIEDEPSIQRLCSEILSHEGYDVDIASSRTEAKLKLVKIQYDLFIIDIKMPEMDGSEIYKYVDKKSPDLLDRIVFTSGDVIGRDTEIFLKKTDRPFLAKPFTPDELVAVVKKTLRRVINE
jgi:two-component system alkaline phosphatase synthesis response regulator PhoP